MNDQLIPCTIALAGAMQACCLVRDIANTGECDHHAFMTNIESLFQLSPNNVVEVFGNVDNIRYGLIHIEKLFHHHKKTEMDLNRYLANMIYLERKLSQHPDMLNLIKQRIDQARVQQEFFKDYHEKVIANLGDLYCQTLSTLKFRIQVTGKPEFLNTQKDMDHVRALLLAGIRAIVLWRQVGGSRWHLIFSRKKIADIAQKILMDELTLSY